MRQVPFQHLTQQAQLRQLQQLQCTQPPLHRLQRVDLRLQCQIRTPLLLEARLAACSRAFREECAELVQQKRKRLFVSSEKSWGSIQSHRPSLPVNRCPARYQLARWRGSLGRPTFGLITDKCS